MHGTGLFITLSTLAGAGTVVLVAETGLDAPRLWSEVERNAVEVLTIVGDVFARPLVDALDREPTRWDLSSLRAITSSGVTWSPDAKAALLRHLPQATLIDSLGASEGIMTRTASKAGADIKPARLRRERPCPRARRGPWHAGRAGKWRRRARRGHRTDPDRLLQGRSEDRRHVPDRRRRSATRSRATTRPSTSTGRSSCSVAARRASTPAARRCTPKRWSSCSASTRRSPTASSSACPTSASARWSSPSSWLPTAPARSTRTTLEAWCRGRVSGYKRPRRFFVVTTLDRSPAGKADYARLRALATELVAAT